MVEPFAFVITLPTSEGKEGKRERQLFTTFYLKTNPLNYLS